MFLLFYHDHSTVRSTCPFMTTAYDHSHHQHTFVCTRCPHALHHSGKEVLIISPHCFLTLTFHFIADEVVIGAMMMSSGESFDNPSHMFCKRLQSTDPAVTTSLLDGMTKAMVPLPADGSVSKLTTLFYCDLNHIRYSTTRTACPSSCSASRGGLILW